MIYNGTGSVEGGTGCYMMVLGQHGAIPVVLDQQRAVMVDTQWYWVSIGRYWLVLGGTGSV